MKLSVLMACLMLSSCASQNMWMVKQRDDGGIIGYKNYDKSHGEQLHQDVAKLVQCPTTYLLEEVASENSVDVERQYSCDTPLALQRAKLSSRCQHGESRQCLELASTYMGIPGEEARVNNLLQKICQMKDASSDTLSISCYLTGAYFIFDKKDPVQGLVFLEKGCAQYSVLDAPNEPAILACGFLGAHKKDDALLTRSIERMQKSCQRDGDCYDISCMYSVYGDQVSALKYLKLTLNGGFKKWDHLARDPDMDNIRHTPEFQNLLESHQGRMPASAVEP